MSNFAFVPIENNLIAAQEQSCHACPEQYEGRLRNPDEAFYFRYRHGRASLGLGPTLGAAIFDEQEASVQVGHGDEGVFDSTQQRDAVFARLLAERRVRKD